MANKKNSDLVELITVADSDYITIRDVSDRTNQATGETKKITQKNLMKLSSSSFSSRDLLIYYAYPSSFNYPTNAWIHENVAKDMAQYNIIVFANGVANTGHTDYSNFCTIIARLKVLKPEIKLFGYVTANQILSTFQTKVDELEAISQIDGIFIDEAGYDYGVTRADLNSRINYVHTSNCNICFANAWNMNHIIGITNDSSYPNSTYNPSLVASRLTASDWYLLESYPCNTTAYGNGYCTVADWLTRGQIAINNRDEFGISLASVSIIDKDDSSAISYFDFHYLTSLTFSLNAQGSSHNLYGANAPIIPFYKRIEWKNMGLAYETKPSVSVATDNWQIHYRYTDKGKMICDYTGTDPIITYSNNIDNCINYGEILTVNDTYKGDIMTVTVDDASTVFGNALYCAADFHYERADADATATMPCVCMALENGAGLKKVLLKGQICDTTWDWAAGLIYVACTTGELTQTTVSGAGDQLQILGHALSNDTIYFNPNLAMVEI